MLEPPKSMTEDIAVILKDPVRRKEFKEEQKERIRNDYIKRYFDGEFN